MIILPSYDDGGGDVDHPKTKTRHLCRSIAFLLIIPFASLYIVYIMRCRPLTVLPPTSEAVVLNSCLCEGSNGYAARDVPTFVGRIGELFYSCLDDAVVQNSWSICVRLQGGGIDSIDGFSVTQMRKVHAQEMESVVFSPTRDFMVVNIPKLKEWADSYIDIRGDLLIRQNSSVYSNLKRVPLKIRKKMHLSVMPVASSPLAVMCSCSPTTKGRGSGTIQHAIGHTSYSCNEGKVFKGIPLQVCMHSKDLRFNKLVSVNLTHPITGSVLRSISAEGDEG